MSDEHSERSQGCVESSLAQAEALGGTRVMGPEKLVDMVELGLFADPEGNLVGV